MTDSAEELFTTNCRWCNQQINHKTKDPEKCAGCNPKYRFLLPEGESEDEALCQNCGKKLKDDHEGRWDYCRIPKNSYYVDQRGRPTGGWKTCCQCRTRLGYDEFEAKACDFCKARSRDWIWLKLAEDWKKVSRATGEFIDGSGFMEPPIEETEHSTNESTESLPDAPSHSKSSRLWSALTCCFTCCTRNTQVAPDAAVEDSSTLTIEFPKHIRALPPWVFKLKTLSSLNLDNCSLLEILPVNQLLTLSRLAELSCTGCPNLWIPPQEVCEQGGEQTMKFLREVQRSGKANNTMMLFLIGDGEAGKTSIARALKSKENSADRIHEDNRTVGIDISTWAPDGCEIEFQLLDLAGQAVYSRTHQLFLQRRALYVLVWRPDGDDITDTVLHWMDSLQIRMPGSFLLIVATHVDMVEPQVLTDKCNEIREVVLKRLAKINEDSKGLVPLLRVCDDGQSVCVNCLTGQGIPELRQKLIAFAEDMPWYKEALPVSWIKVKSKLLDLSKAGRSFLTWKEYESLASKCGLTTESENLAIATGFFHETCVVRYYGSAKHSRKEQPKLRAGASESADPLTSTVFISLNFIVDVMKGLIRHDHDALLEYFMAMQQKHMVRRTNRLSVLGRLHADLVPFLWPSCKKSAGFWDKVRNEKDRESSLWPEDVVSVEADLAKALALLEGFYLIVRKGNEYLVPGLLTDSRTQVCQDAFSDVRCDFETRYVYSALPEGAFDGVIVRIAQRCSRFEFSGRSGVFYRLGNILQVYVATGVDGFQHIFLRSSSRELMEIAIDSINGMEQFLKGLVKIDRDEPKLDEIPDLAQVVILADDGGTVGSLPAKLQEQFTHATGASLTIESQLASSGDYAGDARVVLICMTAGIGSNVTSCSQLQMHIEAKRVIIPLIMPGYSITNYTAWWPPSMQGLEHHKLFVDMRNPNQMLEKITQELMPQLIKFLEEWKAADPAPLAADSNLDIVCEHCAVAGFGITDSHRFSRPDCLQAWNEFVKQKNEGLPVESRIIQCPKCSYNYHLPELLSSGQISEVRPCNVCLASGTYPPGVFKTSECRLLFDEDDRTRVGTVSCTRCQASGRPGQFRIMDVAPAEVFVSYNWGKQLRDGKFSTQQMVSPLLKGIEQEADVVCWFDVGGGMGAGQDQIEEMRLGVTRANVVLMFLSDAYVNSDNCKREFVHTSTNFKFVIPVLVPDTGLQCGNGFSSGWTGPDTPTDGPESANFWQHAEAICRNPQDPDQPSKMVDWSYLGLFQPIRLPANGGPVPGAVVDEIVKRIMSRLHRGNHRSAVR